MLRSKKAKWIVAAAAAVVLAAAVVVVSGENIASNDPLVSLSYLTGTYQKNLNGKIDSAVSAESAAMTAKLEQYVGGTVPQTAAAATHNKVTVPAGTSYTVANGAEFLFLGGAASAAGAGLTDTTDGYAVPASGMLAVNHLYMAGSSVTIAATENAELLIRK